MIDWRHSLEQESPTLRFKEMKMETKGEQHFIDVQVYLNDLDPKTAQVGLCADGAMGAPPGRQKMTCVRSLAGAPAGYAYSAAVSAVSATADYTARSDTELRRHCDAAGRGANPMAAMTRSMVLDWIRFRWAVSPSLTVGFYLIAKRLRRREFKLGQPRRSLCKRFLKPSVKR
jgi:hypothetical protein